MQEKLNGSSPSSLPLTTGETANQHLIFEHKSLTQYLELSGGI